MSNDFFLRDSILVEEDCNLHVYTACIYIYNGHITSVHTKIPHCNLLKGCLGKFLFERKRGLYLNISWLDGSWVACCL